jgi:alpha-beta hydrolase superfamily lysophospholipase
MKLGVSLSVVFMLLTAIICTVAAMIIFGTANAPPPLESISRPFAKVDFRDLPTVKQFPARAGGSIAFREWIPNIAGEPETVVIAIHGSSADSSSLHHLARALSSTGLKVFAPDIRGHGGTGRRGDIDGPQQLDGDLVDFVASVKSRHPQARLVLLGFSSGGGFALHAAGSKLGRDFDRAVLLSPMLGVDAPTVKDGAAAWAAPYIPRILGLMALNGIGIHALDSLPVLAFAIPPSQAGLLTGEYSFRLMRAFGTNDYAADLRTASAPIAILIGERDELFCAERFAPTVHAIRPEVPVTIVPDLNHVEMTTDDRAFPAIIAAISGAG